MAPSSSPTSTTKNNHITTPTTALPSSSSSRIISLLAASRLAFGTLSLLFPAPTLQLFQLLPPLSSTSTSSSSSSFLSSTNTALLPTRMFGIRDAVLGALLYKAAAATAPDSTTTTGVAAQRALLLAGAVVDAVDTLSCAWGYFVTGEIGSGLAAGLVGGGAVVFLLWGVWGLSVLGREGDSEGGKEWGVAGAGVREK